MERAFFARRTRTVGGVIYINAGLSSNQISTTSSSAILVCKPNIGNMYTSSFLGLAALLAGSAQAALVEHYWNITYTQANPDGLYERTVIGVNGTWPSVSHPPEPHLVCTI